MVKELKNIKTNDKKIRSFGISIGIILLIISGFLFFFNNESFRTFGYLAGFFICLGLTVPILLKPIYLIWMTFSIILGWIMTRVILSVVFYLILTPIGLITKLLNEDFLALKKTNVKSYWNNRDSNFEIKQDYEKQF